MKRSAADQKPGRCSVSACKELKGSKKKKKSSSCFFFLLKRNESLYDVTTHRLDVGNIKEKQTFFFFF